MWCSCFKKNSRPRRQDVTQETQSAPQPYTVHNPRAAPRPSRSSYQNRAIPTVPCIAVDTKYEFRDFKGKDCTPSKSQQRKFRYPCPICFKVFNCMLETQCCWKYLCLPCAYDMADNGQVRCAYCNREGFVLRDVDPRAPVKMYSDTPAPSQYGSCKQTPAEFGSANGLNRASGVRQDVRRLSFENVEPTPEQQLEESKIQEAEEDIEVTEFRVHVTRRIGRDRF